MKTTFLRFKTSDTFFLLYLYKYTTLQSVHNGILHTKSLALPIVDS